MDKSDCTAVWTDVAQRPCRRAAKHQEGRRRGACAGVGPGKGGSRCNRGGGGGIGMNFYIINYKASFLDQVAGKEAISTFERISSL